MNMPMALSLILAQLVAGEVRSAEDARRVVLFPVEDDAALHARLGAELRSQGFEPIDVGAPSAGGGQTLGGGQTFDPLWASIRTTHAERALRIERAPGSIRLWIANAATGKQIYREAPSSPERADAAIVSLWAVEALRASGVAPEPLPPAAVATAPSSPTTTPARARTLALQIAPAAAVSPGGIGPSAQLLVGVRWLETRRAGAELILVFPTAPAHLERAMGSATISIGLLAAGPVLSVGGVETRWSGQLGAGAALTLVRVSGVGAADYLGQTDHVVGGGPYARAGVALKLSRVLRLRGDGMVGAVFPRPVVYFAEQRVADWGRPWLAGAVGVEAIF
jgi:hypothetical protein